jgi:hypothetical protein
VCIVPDVEVRGQNAAERRECDVQERAVRVHNGSFVNALRRRLAAFAHFSRLPLD